MTQYRLEPTASADLEAIVAYISRDDPEAGLRTFDRITAALRSLAVFPLIGHERTDLVAPPMRFLTVGSYVIVYRHDARPVQILRVLHGARDLPALLDDERPRSDDHVSDRVATSPYVTRPRTQVSLPGRVAEPRPLSRRPSLGRHPDRAGIEIEQASSSRMGPSLAVA